jgi:hypothetical protein
MLINSTLGAEKLNKMLHGIQVPTGFSLKKPNELRNNRRSTSDINKRKNK